MNKIISILSIILGIICFFMLGVYTDAYLGYGKIIPINRWVVISIVGFFSIIYGIKKSFKINK